MILYRMTYDNLNKIHGQRMTITNDNYIASMGGVGRPWNKLNVNHAKTFRIQDSDAFAIFHLIDLEHRPKQESPWKIHLSIHPDDLGKAWDLIYPRLIKNQISEFKVSRNIVIKTLMSRMGLVSDTFRNTNSLDLEDIEQSLEDLSRVYYGMQITIYINEDEEPLCNKLLEEIEPLLYEAGIRPGIIDKSDRALGLYSSIRHVGDSYTSHDKVSGYKSVVVKDPFKPVKLHYHRMQVPWSKLDFPRQIAKLKMTLQQVLDGKRKYDIAIIDKREFVQVCEVAKEYFDRWMHIVTKCKTSGVHNQFKKWIEEGYQLIELIQGSKARQLKEMEDVILSVSRIEMPKDRPKPTLQRTNATRGFSIFHYEPTRVVVPHRELNTEDILKQLAQKEDMDCLQP